MKPKRSLFGNAFITLVGMGLSCTCAAMDLAHYQIVRPNLDKDPVNGMYVIGLGQGVFWSNVVLKLKKQPRLFCPPPKLQFTGDFLMSLLNQEIDEPANGSAHRPDEDIELIMIEALAGRFPCAEMK